MSLAKSLNAFRFIIGNGPEIGWNGIAAILDIGAVRSTSRLVMQSNDATQGHALKSHAVGFGGGIWEIEVEGKRSVRISPSVDPFS